jgi:hypothetical protein
MDQNNTLGIIQHINHETSLHKEHHFSTSHIFELHKQKCGKLEEHRKKILHKQKWGKLEEPPFVFCRKTSYFLSPTVVEAYLNFSSPPYP